MALQGVVGSKVVTALSTVGCPCYPGLGSGILQSRIGILQSRTGILKSRIGERDPEIQDWDPEIQEWDPAIQDWGEGACNPCDVKSRLREPNPRNAGLGSSGSTSKGCHCLSHVWLGALGMGRGCT